jgi:hypothetical protein
MCRRLELRYHQCDGNLAPAGRVFEKHDLHRTASVKNDKTGDVRTMERAFVQPLFP